jgi:hypothetical protein
MVKSNEVKPIKLEPLEKIIELEKFKCVHKISEDFDHIAYLGERCEKCSGYNIQCLFYFPNNKIYGSKE